MYTFGLEEDMQAFISFVEARNGSFMQLDVYKRQTLCYAMQTCRRTDGLK